MKYRPRLDAASLPSLLVTEGFINALGVVTSMRTGSITLRALYEGIQNVQRKLDELTASHHDGSRREYDTKPTMGAGGAKGVQVGNHPNGRNLRSVWHIATQPYVGAHFATFPEKLVELCIKAGTSVKGCCPECRAPWKREVRRDRTATRPGKNNVYDPSGKANRDTRRHITATTTVGWSPACRCDSHHPVPCTVLDPFMGSGTTAVVAKKLGRHFIGFELNPEYVKMARQRLRHRASSGGQSAAA